jgi:hypothetical protein
MIEGNKLLCTDDFRTRKIKCFVPKAVDYADLNAFFCSFYLTIFLMTLLWPISERSTPAAS